MRPIRVTEDLIEKWVQEFKDQLKQTNMFEGNFKFEKSLKYEDNGTKAKVIFTQPAYMKMLSLVYAYDGEVGWHGFVEKTGEHEYRVFDIIVYPQTVTGVTVNTDQKEYTDWLLRIPEDKLAKMRLNGHSHVNMSVNPSNDDLRSWSSLVSQLSDEDFYIFMIVNKKLDFTIKVYDAKENVAYDEKGECEIEIENDSLNLDEFLLESRGMTRTNKPASTVKPIETGKKSKSKASKYDSGYSSCYGGYDGYGGYGGYGGYKRLSGYLDDEEEF